MLQNIFWAEYLQTQRERLESITNDIRSNIAIVQEMEETLKRQIMRRIDILLSKATMAECLLIEFEKESFMKQNIESEKKKNLDFWNRSIDRYRDFHVLSNQIPIGHANLLIPISLSCLRLPQSPSPKIGSLSVSEDFHATSVLLEECHRIIYDDVSSTSDFPRPIPICWPQHDYSFLSNSHSIGVPPSDVYRCYLWPSIIHEDFHGRINEIEAFARQLMSEDYSKGRASRKQDIFAEEKLKPAVKEWLLLREVLAREIKEQTLGIHYDYSWRFLEKDRCIPPLSYYITQVNEIMCDLAAIKLLGPANFLATGVSWAAPCRSPFYGVDKYLADPSHPPEVVRLHCMIDTMESSDMGYSNDDYLKEWKIDFSELTTFDVKEECELFSKYKRVIKPFLPKLSQLASSFIKKNDLFTNEKWKKLRDGYESSREITKILDFMLPHEQARSLINVAWLKRVEIFREKLQRVPDPESFKRAHADAKQFFVHIVKFMAKMR